MSRMPLKIQGEHKNTP